MKNASLIVGELFLLPMIIVAVQWDGPSPTAELEPDAAHLGWTPRPTQASGKKYIELELFRRGTVATCGWINGVGNDPFTCPDGYECVTNTQNDVAACCNTAQPLNSCTLPTACFDSTAQNNCASCSADPYNWLCNNGVNPYCFVAYYNYGGVTMSGFGCTDQSSAILIVETTYSGEDAASSSAAKVSYVDDPYTIAVTQPVTSSSGNPSLSSAVPSTSPTSTGSSATTHISSRTSPASKPTINSATSSSPTSGAVGPTTATASPLPTIIASSTPIGAIVGGVIGGLAVVGAIIGALVYMCLRHRRNRNNEGAVVGTSEHHQPYNDSKSPMVMAQHQPILAQEGGPGAVTYYSPPQNEKKFAQVQIQHSNSYASAGSGRSTYSPPISPSPQYVPLPSHSPAPQFLPGSPHSSSISPPISPPLQAEFVELGQYGTLGPSTHSPTAFEAPT